MIADGTFQIRKELCAENALELWKPVCAKTFRRLIKNKYQNPLKCALSVSKQFCFHKFVFWKNQRHVHKGIPVE